MNIMGFRILIRLLQLMMRSCCFEKNLVVLPWQRVGRRLRGGRRRVAQVVKELGVAVVTNRRVVVGDQLVGKMVLVMVGGSSISIRMTEEVQLGEVRRGWSRRVIVNRMLMIAQAALPVVMMTTWMLTSSQTVETATTETPM